MAEEALASSRDPVPLHAFLGMVRAREGELDRAADHLGAAHAGRPGDTTIACNLIAVLIDAGRMERALDVATPALAAADHTLRVMRYRGFTAQTLARFDEAARAYEAVVARAPQDVESWNNLGNARSALGDHEGAIAALERAVALDRLAAPARLNLANALRAAGRLGDAERVLRDAARTFPGDVHVPETLYALLKIDGRDDEALGAIEEAVARDPDHAGTQLKLAIEYGLAMRPEAAEQAYRRVLVLAPRERDAYLGLAINYEHTNREEELSPLVALAERNGVDAGTLAFLRAFELRRAGRFEEALQMLAGVPDDIEPERTAHLRATLHDRLGRYEEAFAWFEETARRHAAHPSEPLTRAAEVRASLRRELDVMTPDWVAGWSAVSVADDGRADPIFLVGFPRSGTTLLDTILMGHPDTVVLEEKPPLNVVSDTIGSVERLPSLGSGAIAAARARYFAEVEKITPLEPGRLLIDKSPLFLHKVPLIARLFPRARFILALRHPCDVLLSCYMSNFRLNRAMSNFLRLDDAAEFYDLAFSHWERATALLPVQRHVIAYERLIDDVEGTVRPLLAWLNLDWRPEVLDHAATARARGLITTASYAQVVEPIYKRAVGRWHRYRSHLEPILPTLEPWVAKFGYEI